MRKTLTFYEKHLFLTQKQEKQLYMGPFYHECVAVNAIYLNAKHLPQNEYENLDMFVDYPNDFGIQASVYSTGVIIYMEDYKGEEVKELGFPVLANILFLADEDDIMFIDFYENRKQDLDNLKVYDWD